MKTRKATLFDAKPIQQLINAFADQGEMLPRSLSNIYETIRSFYVVEEKEKLVACASFSTTWDDLAEVRSLVVHDAYQKQGIGKQLMSVGTDDLKILGVKRIFALTYKPEFFVKCGFEQVEKQVLPHKIWTECIHCPKFPDCDEIAFMKVL